MALLSGLLYGKNSYIFVEELGAQINEYSYIDEHKNILH